MLASTRNYKSLLQNTLFSEENVQNLIDNILQNFKISSKAVTKCHNIIINNFRSYLDAINRYPENDAELVKAVEFLNDKCYNDFTAYLANKYPNMNLSRGNPVNKNVKNTIENHIELHNPHSLATSPASAHEEIIVMSEQTKNELLAKYKIAPTTNNNNNNNNNANNDIFTYLTNPTIWQMFTMVNQLAQPSKHIVIDEILDEQQVKKLMSNQHTTIEKTPQMQECQTVRASTASVAPLASTAPVTPVTPASTAPVTPASTAPVTPASTAPVTPASTHVKELRQTAKKHEPAKSVQKITDDDVIIYDSMVTDTSPAQKLTAINSDKDATNYNDDNNDNDAIINDEPVMTSLKTDDDEIVNEDDHNVKAKYDLNHITPEMLPSIVARVNELSALKNKYLAEKNINQVSEIDAEKERIIAAVKNYKRDLDKLSQDSESKISNITSNSRKSDDKTEYLDLKFDPTNDYNDLKNIVIKFKSDDKITEITLVDYYLPYNSHNITRFNNKFVVYFNNRLTRIVVPPGKYEIQALLDYIRGQATFLDFVVNDTGIITIKNTMNVKFDLMLGEDTVFGLLGFNGKMESYKDKLFYSGNRAYCTNANEQVFFTLSGSTMEPMLMEFDKNVEINRQLKKSRSGVLMRQMVLHFSDTIRSVMILLCHSKCVSVFHISKINESSSFIFHSHLSLAACLLGLLRK